MGRLQGTFCNRWVLDAGAGGQDSRRHLIYNMLIYQPDMNICSYQNFFQGRKRQESDKLKLTPEEYSFFAAFPFA